jgi:hypothetical protein
VQSAQARLDAPPEHDGAALGEEVCAARLDALLGAARLDAPPEHDGALREAAQQLVAAVRAAATSLPPLLDTSFDIWDVSLTYGELLPCSLASALQLGVSLLPPPLRGGGAVTFLDLGSGEGIPCILAAALFPAFSSVRGVELLPRLHAAAERHRACAAAALLPGGPAAAERVRRVALRCADMMEGLEAALAASDVVFFLGTCFGEDVLGPLWAAAAGMRCGAVLICATHEAPAGGALELAATQAAAAAWGSDVTLRFYRRRA